MTKASKAMVAFKVSRYEFLGHGVYRKHEMTIIPYMNFLSHYLPLSMHLFLFIKFAATYFLKKIWHDNYKYNLFYQYFEH